MFLYMIWVKKIAIKYTHFIRTDVKINPQTQKKWRKKYQKFIKIIHVICNFGNFSIKRNKGNTTFT